MKNKLIGICILLSFCFQIIALPINVSIVGNLDNPGVYILDSSNRISQALQYVELNLITDPTDMIRPPSQLDDMSELKIDTSMLEEQKKALATQNMKNKSTYYTQLEEEDVETFKARPISKRKVILIRNKVQQELNLQDFYVNGNIANNPYLQNDDVVKLLPLATSVRLTGEVNREGLYELIEGEKLTDLIGFGQGLTKDADLQNILVERYDPESGKLQTWSIDYSAISNNYDSADNLTLAHNDEVRVFKKPYLNKKKVVEVSGLVRYPGEYSIDQNSTLLSVLESAGGPLPNADLNFAIMIDKSLFESYNPDLERLLASNPALMTIAEYSYYQTKLREIAGKHFIDIKQLWETKDAQYDRKVQAGDMIYLKEPFLLVNVSGAVQNAGLQAWEEGKSWKEYVDAAGGFALNAYKSKLRVIKYNTNAWAKVKKSTVINPGDEIFVPEFKDKSTWEYITEGLAVTAQVVTVILGIHTITK